MCVSMDLALYFYFLKCLPYYFLPFYGRLCPRTYSFLLCSEVSVLMNVLSFFFFAKMIGFQKILNTRVKWWVNKRHSFNHLIIPINTSCEDMSHKTRTLKHVIHTFIPTTIRTRPKHIYPHTVICERSMHLSTQ